MQHSAYIEPRSGDQQPLPETYDTDHEASGVTIGGPTPGPTHDLDVGSTPGLNHVVITKALVIDPPPGLSSGVSHSAHPETIEQPQEPLSGVSQPAHPAIVESPPGLSAGVSFPAHPDSSSTGTGGPDADMPSPSASERALLYASSGMHQALTSCLNQSNHHSINRYLGWPCVCSIFLPSPGDEGSDVRANHSSREHKARNSSDDEYHHKQYDRTSLLSIGHNSDLSTWCPWIHVRHSGLPKLTDCRELDFHGYNGRYVTTTESIHHSSNLDDCHAIIHVQQRPHTEPRSTTYPSTCSAHPCKEWRLRRCA